MIGLALWSLALVPRSPPPGRLVAASKPGCRALTPRATTTEETESEDASLKPIDVLIRYGPVAFSSRVLAHEDFEASVRVFMKQHPGSSRGLAEQTVHKSLSECGTFWRGTPIHPAAEQRDGTPELLPPVTAGEQALVLSWVAMLMLGAARLYVLCITAPPLEPSAVRSATESLLSVPAASLDDLSQAFR
jgi:hypothetical protein